MRRVVLAISIITIAIAGIYIFAPDTNTVFIYQQEHENELPIVTENIIEDHGENKEEENFKELTPVKQAIPKETRGVLSPATYTRGLESTVNLLCSIEGKGYTVATGAIINKNGYIISNAHIASGLGDNPTCAVRIGSPAKLFGTAKLILVPTSFREATSEEMSARSDISIWKIIESGKAPFAAWNVDFNTPLFEREQLFALSYPAEFLDSKTILGSLDLVLASTFTEASDTYIVRTSSSQGAQRGSSGGILVDPYELTIRGLIFAIDNNERKMFSLTTKAIDESIKRETGVTLEEYLAGNP